MTDLRRADVFVRKADYIIAPSSRAVTGLWIIWTPIIRLEKSASASDLGSAVRDALGASLWDVPIPAADNSVLTELFAVANVRSWNAIQRSAQMCSVEERGDVIEVARSENSGTRGNGKGYHGLINGAIHVRVTASDDELGDAVLAALAICR